MPVKGISDIVRLPRVGKIKLGEEKREGAFPKDLTYFRFAPDDESLLPLLQEAYGEKPDALTVWLPSLDLDTVFPQYYRWWGKGGKLKCKGDGETGLRVVEGGQVEVACPCENHESYGGDCTLQGNLIVILPDVGLGVWQIDTGSFYGIVDVNNDLRLIAAALLSAGVQNPMGIDMLLTREPKQMTPWITGKDGAKKQITVVKHTLRLRCPHVESMRQLQSMGREALAGAPEPPRALPTGDEDMPEDLVPNAAPKAPSLAERVAAVNGNADNGEPPANGATDDGPDDAPPKGVGALAREKAGLPRDPNGALDRPVETNVRPDFDPRQAQRRMRPTKNDAQPTLPDEPAPLPDDIPPPTDDDAGYDF